MTDRNWIDRIVRVFSPLSAVRRAQARAALRHYDGATAGRRGAGIHRKSGDANAINKPALAALRATARDLTRNNGWARRAVQIIGNNTVGWGIVGKVSSPELNERWLAWAKTTACDARGRLNFYGLERLVMDTVVTSGEILALRHDYVAGVPLKIELLEPEYIDTSKPGDGIELDSAGLPAFYWLFEKHPGSVGATAKSTRVPASRVAHVFRPDRPGQSRGVSWFAAAVLKLSDFDAYEDALLMRQKVAACFAAFVTDADGTGSPLGATDSPDDSIDSLEPGTIVNLKPGQSVLFGTPPPVSDNEAFSKSSLRSVAASMGVTYEELTGDFSQSNFSSNRMSRIAHWANVHDWRWNMLIPQFCERVFEWFLQAQQVAGPNQATIIWSPPPMPMIEPDKEGLAYARLVRAGAMTHDEMVRDRGGDPTQHWDEYAAGLAALDKRGIVLDSDPRKTSAAGLTQERAGGGQSSSEQGA
jgi:lambda family phage portal protein